jgi:hypothetical protein
MMQRIAGASARGETLQAPNERSFSVLRLTRQCYRSLPCWTNFYKMIGLLRIEPYTL